MLINGFRVAYGSNEKNWKRIICWLTNHKWELEHDPRFFYEKELPYMVEMHDIICRRCGWEVRDFCIMASKP